MKCEKCKMVEMRLEKVKDDVMYFKCKKCENEISMSEEQFKKKDIP